DVGQFASGCASSTHPRHGSRMGGMFGSLARAVQQQTHNNNPNEIQAARRVIGAPAPQNASDSSISAACSKAKRTALSDRRRGALRRTYLLTSRSRRRGARMTQFRTLHDIVKAARTNLTHHTWDYLIGGADTETSLKRNRFALDSLAFRPRVLNDVSSVDT